MVVVVWDVNLLLSSSNWFGCVHRLLDWLRNCSETRRDIIMHRKWKSGKMRVKLKLRVIALLHYYKLPLPLLLPLVQLISLKILWKNLKNHHQWSPWQPTSSSSSCISNAQLVAQHYLTYLHTYLPPLYHLVRVIITRMRIIILLDFMYFYYYAATRK